MNPSTLPQPTIVKSDDTFSTLLNRSHSASAIEAVVNKSSDPTKTIESFGTWISKSGLFGCEKLEQGIIIAIACMEMGIGLVEFSQTYDIIGHSGKLRKKAMAAAAEFQADGGEIKWIDCGETGEKAEVELTFRGQSRKFVFTLDEARRAKIVKTGGAWETWTADMLCARAVSRGIARMCPKIYAGFEADDEVGSVPSLVLPAIPVEPKAKTEVPASVRAEEPKIQAQQTPAQSDPTPVASTPAATASEPALLPEDTAEQIAEAIGPENVIKALRWMQRQTPPWLTAEQVATGEGFRYLKTGRVNKILNQKDSFIRAINNPAQTA